MMSATGAMSLLCTEALEDMTDFPASPSPQPIRAPQLELPPTVKAIQDPSQLKDHRRILQNLLRNQDQYLPYSKDFLTHVQGDLITPQMRKIVGDWMRDVILEQNCSPEVITLSMNIMDRFLSCCKLSSPSQLQLLGSVCILVASKIREPCSIAGKSLITYTDNSISSDDLKDWELLLLNRLQWEMSAITAMDFLDHLLPRLELPQLDLNELRKYAETILVLVSNDYNFSCHLPSLLATSAITISTQCLSNSPVIRKSVKLTLQTITHSGTDQLDQCINEISSILPSYLMPQPEQQEIYSEESLDDESCLMDQSTEQQQASSSTDVAIVPDNSNNTSILEEVLSQGASPVPNLLCCESLEEDGEDDLGSSRDSSCNSEDFGAIVRSDSPLSAVDIFTDFNTGVLAAVFEQADSPATSKNSTDSPFSILVS